MSDTENHKTVEGEGVGEGVHTPEYKSPLAQREISERKQTNPGDDRARQDRINREEALHRGGFPIAGHEPEDNDNSPSW